MKEFLEEHEFIVFLAIMLAIVAVCFIVIFGASDHVSTTRSWHYQCYSGGVLVIDQEYPLNGLGHPLDPETHERVYFKGMDCVVTR